MLEFVTAGESHGKALVAVLSGMPAGLFITPDDINKDLARRQKGYGRGGRMRIEKDRVEVLSGLRHGMTIGSPITMMVPNLDWENWDETMSPWSVEGAAAAPRQPVREVHRPRPGHADLAGGVKYGHGDLRNVLERASARTTAADVAAGAVCRKFLAEFGVRIGSHVRSIGTVGLSTRSGPVSDVSGVVAAAESSPVSCADATAAADMIKLIDEARAAGDTLGGVFEVMVSGLPVGLGSHVSWDRRLDGRLAQALMSIPAIKGVEIGDGFEAAARFGSQVHDPILSGFDRPTNHAGGLEGGITNGETLVVRGAMKPIATLMKPLPSVDLRTGLPVEAATERSDVCAVEAAAVVAEARVAYVLAGAWVEKFGGDSVAECRRNYESCVRGTFAGEQER